jgi:hypothetical protein
MKIYVNTLKKLTHVHMPNQNAYYKLITFVKRDNNRAAHILAKHAAKDAMGTTWHVMRPECICETLLTEEFALVL